MIDVNIQQRLGGFELQVQFTADSKIVGVFGRSGAGKSSLMNAIAGVARPQRGWIRLDGATLFDSERHIDVPVRKRRIGYVFQDALLFPHLSVESNLYYGYRLRSTVDRFIEPARVIDVLGLATLLVRKPQTLSGGEKQRVAIGRALLAQPRVLLMDEPLASLDVPRKTEILDYVERLRDAFDIPIVYVSHSVPEITRLADTVVVLTEGKCVAAGDVDKVMTRLDLKPYTGRHEAGSIIETTVKSQDPKHQLSTLSFSGGELIVPKLDAAIGERVRARVRARDVSLAMQRPLGISILNILSARVVAVREEVGPIVDVQLATGDAMLLARITRRSLEELGVREGQTLYALIKAISFDDRSTGYVQTFQEINR